MPRLIALLVYVSLLLADRTGAQAPQQRRTAEGSPNNTSKKKPPNRAAELGSANSTTSVAQAIPPAASKKHSINWCQQGSKEPWPLSAISATNSTLPAATEHVLICIISSGVAYNINYLKHNGWSGCYREHPLDPGGCHLLWSFPLDDKGNWKPRGTYAAALMAGRPGIDPRIRGVIPSKAELHVVPIDTNTGTIEPRSSAAGGRSRIRAYSACEGKLRGLQAQDVGLYAPPVQWRMVMYVDIQGKNPAAPIGTQEFKVTESDWFRTATGKTDDGRAPDVLVVAPAGDSPGTLAYPALYPSVIAVGGYSCDGKPINSYPASSSVVKPDILAPGKGIPVPDVKRFGPGGVRGWEGSAAAAAYTAAAAARLWTAYPDCSADEIRAALLSSRPADKAPAMLDLEHAQRFLSQHTCSSS